MLKTFWWGGGVQESFPRHSPFLSLTAWASLVAAFSVRTYPSTACHAPKPHSGAGFQAQQPCVRTPPSTNVPLLRVTNSTIPRVQIPADENSPNNRHKYRNPRQSKMTVWAGRSCAAARVGGTFLPGSFRNDQEPLRETHPPYCHPERSGSSQSERPQVEGPRARMHKHRLTERVPMNRLVPISPSS